MFPYDCRLTKVCAKFSTLKEAYARLTSTNEWIGRENEWQNLEVGHIYI